MSTDVTDDPRLHSLAVELRSVLDRIHDHAPPVPLDDLAFELARVAIAELPPPTATQGERTWREERELTVKFLVDESTRYKQHAIKWDTIHGNEILKQAWTNAARTAERLMNAIIRGEHVSHVTAIPAGETPQVRAGARCTLCFGRLDPSHFPVATEDGWRHAACPKSGEPPATKETT